MTARSSTLSLPIWAKLTAIFMMLYVLFVIYVIISFDFKTERRNAAGINHSYNRVKRIRQWDTLLIEKRQKRHSKDTVHHLYERL